MSFDRYAGRKCPERGGDFPRGCAGPSANTLTPCTVQLRGRLCLLCERDGDIPFGERWKREAKRFDGRSVQVVPVAGRPPLWLVATFASGLLIDARRPVIACASAGEAREVAMARARQVEPSAPVERHKSGGWRVGSVIVSSIPEGPPSPLCGGVGSGVDG